MIISCRLPDADPDTIRISLDTKAVVAIGDLSRGGKSRQGEQALDHDFAPECKVVPFGLFRPDTSETWLYFTSGPATADFMVDRLQELWLSNVNYFVRFATITLSGFPPYFASVFSPLISFIFIGHCCQDLP